MIQHHPIEKEEIEQLLKRHRFSGTQFRINVVENPETIVLKNGRIALKYRIKSDIKKRNIDQCCKKAPTLDRPNNNKQEFEMR